LWSETVYQLQVKDVEPVAVMDIHAWNLVLVEERFATVPEVAINTFTARTSKGVRTVPKILSSSRRFPIYVPSIPRICDALLDQLRYRITHAENFPRKLGNRPSYHLSNLVRYLYLERESQLELLLSQLAERNRAEMKEKASTFKRKPTLAMTLESMKKIQYLR
jgi:hypothetical protein